MKSRLSANNPSARFTVALLSVMLLVATACGNDDDSAQPGDSDRPEEFVIGSILPLTGPASAVGEQFKKAQDLYFADVTEVDGIPVRVETCDDGTMPDRAAACARQLIQRDQAQIILGPTIAGSHNGAEPVLRDGPVNLVATPYVHPEPDTSIFLVAGTSQDIHTTSLAFAAENGWTRVGVLATTDSTGQIGVEEQAEPAEELGLELKTERMDVTDEDATAQMNSLKDFNPDVIALWMSGTPNAIAFQALQQLDMEDVPVIIIFSNIANAFINAVGPLLPTNLYVAASDIYDLESLEDEEIVEELQAWEDAFTEEYGEPSDPLTNLPYDKFKLSVELLEETGGERDAMIEYLEGLDEHRLLNWVVGYSSDDHLGVDEGNYRMFEVANDGTLTLAE